MSQERIIQSEDGPVFIIETATQQRVVPGPSYINETIASVVSTSIVGKRAFTMFAEYSEIWKQPKSRISFNYPVAVAQNDGFPYQKSSLNLFYNNEQWRQPKAKMRFASPIARRNKATFYSVT